MDPGGEKVMSQVSAFDLSLNNQSGNTSNAKPPVNEIIKTLFFIHVMEYYSASERNTIMSGAITCLEFRKLYYVRETKCKTHLLIPFI